MVTRITRNHSSIRSHGTFDYTRDLVVWALCLIRCLKTKLGNRCVQLVAPNSSGIRRCWCFTILSYVHVIWSCSVVQVPPAKFSCYGYKLLLRVETADQLVDETHHSAEENIQFTNWVQIMEQVLNCSSSPSAGKTSGLKTIIALKTGK